MEDKIRVGIVSYLNTRPLIYGLQQTSIKNDIELIEETPARLAEMLLENKIDVGLVPVAIIPRLPEYHIVGSHCIAADGRVASVALFSKVPLHEIKTVLLDYQSRTSVNLAKWLFTHYWKLPVTFVDAANDDYIRMINGNTAGVIIGDRALQQLHNFEYIYDLAENWKNATGLPFVFAAWVSVKKLPDVFIAAFDVANGFGVERLDEVIADQETIKYYDLYTYYTENLRYMIDDEKEKGMSKFINAIKI